MRILQVTPYFAPAWAYGGPPRSVYELSQELVRRGHSVTVLTTDALDAQRRTSVSEENWDGIRIRRCRNLSNRLAWNQQLFLPRGTGVFLRDHLTEYDVVHLHMYRTVQDVAVHRYALRREVPYVFSARGSLPRIVRRRVTKGLFDVAIGRRLLQHAARLVASSRAEMRQYEAMGVPMSRITIVPNGIDASAYGKLPPKGTFARRYGLEGRRLVTYVGRLNERKGLRCLLRAFQRLRATEDDLVLSLVGPDEGYRTSLEDLAKELGIKDRILFTGLVVGPERLGAFVDAEVLVYPAIDEVFGRVPFEALLCGTPVVVSNDSGCGEIIEGAGAGLTFPPDDVAGLRDAIAASLGDRSRAAERVRRGKEFVLEELNWGRVGAAVEGVYREAAYSAGQESASPSWRSDNGVAR